jgi:hypothetical protein
LSALPLNSSASRVTTGESPIGQNTSDNLSKPFHRVLTIIDHSTDAALADTG